MGLGAGDDATASQFQMATPATHQHQGVVPTQEEDDFKLRTYS